MVAREIILYLDTESDPKSKQPDTIQWRFKGQHGVIADFNDDTFYFIKSMWDEADAVILQNAPYDLGALTIFYRQNRCSWGNFRVSRTGSWNFILFGNVYNVRKIAGHRNMISPSNRLELSCFGTPIPSLNIKHHKSFEDVDGKPLRMTRDGLLTIPKSPSTPIIDLLKLWSIIMEDEDECYEKGWSLSLKTTADGRKGLIERWLHRKPIQYDKTITRQPDEYLYQDVDCLEELWNVFTSHLPDTLKSTSLKAWGDVKTVATLVKWEYDRAYTTVEGNFSDYREANLEQDRLFGLGNALEHAYHGGFTIAWWRGPLSNIAGVDIHSAYATCQREYDIERYITYEWKTISEYTDSIDTLYEVKCNFHFETMNGGMKVFKTTSPCSSFLWHDDVEAFKLLDPDFKFTIVRAWQAIPTFPKSQNLVKFWIAEREKYEKGTTSNTYFKKMSNVAYGIKCQRWPMPTKFTNMVAGGMITAKCHLVLAQIMNELVMMGKHLRYNDTDSCFFQGGMNIDEFNRVNKRIAPFSVSFEGAFKEGDIRSLKRYALWKGKDLDGKPIRDKVTVHGRSRYDVTKAEILYYIQHGKVEHDRTVNCIQVGANTARTLLYLIQSHPEITHPHPFMFVDREPAIVTQGTWPPKLNDRRIKRKVRFLKLSEFMKDWYSHIDSKTTSPRTHPDLYDLKCKSFERYVPSFPDKLNAKRYYTQFMCEQDTLPDSVEDARNWDTELAEDMKVLYREDEWEALLEWKLDNYMAMEARYKPTKRQRIAKTLALEDYDPNLTTAENAHDTEVKDIIHNRN
jgi:hypothetical protein